MDGTRDHHVKQNTSDAERPVFHVFSYMRKLKEKETKVEELLGKGKETSGRAERENRKCTKRDGCN